MRTFASLVLGALTLSIALIPAAALADDGLTVFVFVTPPGREVGQTIDVHVEAYMWGTPVDLDNVTVTVGFGTDVTLMDVSTGKWHGTYTINASDALGGTLMITANGELGLLSAFEYAGYNLPDNTASVGWEVKTRVANQGIIALSPAPGSNVVVEGRSYQDGTLRDGGQLNATARITEGTNTTSTPLTSTKVSDGVYQFTIQVPADITNTRMYSVEVKLGAGGFAQTDFETFVVNPVPVAAWVSSSTTTSAVVKVLAGSTSPIAGATVSVSGAVITVFPTGITPIAAVTGTTDARGQATVNISWSAAGAATLVANISSGGKMTTVTLYAIGGSGPLPWIPDPNIPFGCSAALQTNPTDFKAGQTANLKVRVTDSGTLMASQSLARFVARSTASGTVQAGNVTTDAQGNLTITYVIPNDWNNEDHLDITVVCPSGDAAHETVSFAFNLGGGTDHISVVVSPASVGGKLHIVASYTGSVPLVGITGGAILVPGGSFSGLATAVGGNTPSAIFAQSGNTFTGDIDIPSFYPEGDYTLIVGIQNEAAVTLLSQEVSEGNISVIHIGPAGGIGQPGSFIPGFEAPLVAAAAVVGVAALRRRRSA